MNVFILLPLLQWDFVVELGTIVLKAFFVQMQFLLDMFLTLRTSVSGMCVWQWDRDIPDTINHYLRMDIVSAHVCSGHQAASY